MSLPSELRASLPASLGPEAVRSAIRGAGSRDSLGGETWLIELEGGLAVLSRSSIFDALDWVPLANDGAPAVSSSTALTEQTHSPRGLVFIVMIVLGVVGYLLFQ